MTKTPNKRRPRSPILLCCLIGLFHVLLLTNKQSLFSLSSYYDYLPFTRTIISSAVLPLSPAYATDNASLYSLETLCDECQQAMVERSFKCVDRMQRYLTGTSNNVTSFYQAQTIVSQEYTECSVCDPKTCRKETSSEEQESLVMTTNDKTDNKNTSLLSTSAAKDEFFRMTYRGDSGLGHRLVRMSSAYHLAKALNLSSLHPTWGWQCGRNADGDPDIFDHLFGKSPLPVSPSTEPIFPWINTTKRTHYANDTRKREIKFINEVPGYSHRMGPGARLEAIQKHGKQQSDVEFYSLLKERFRFQEEANAFMETHAFQNFTMVGLHVRAGNGEKGDFARKGRGVDDLDRWTSNVAELLQKLAMSNYYIRNNKPMKVFLATDTPSVLHKLMNATTTTKDSTSSVQVIMFEQTRVEEGKGVSYFHKWKDNNQDAMCHRGWVDQFMDMVLLASCDMVVAGQYSSFTQSMPLSLMTTTTTTTTTTIAAQRRQDELHQPGKAFCEIGQVGDMMECYNNYTEWMLSYPSSLPIVGNSSSIRQKRLFQLKLPHPTAQEEVQKAFAGTILEDYFSS